MKRLAGDARVACGALGVAALLVVLVAAFPASALAAEPPAPPQGLYALPGEREPVVASLVWTPSPSPDVIAYRVYQSASVDGPFRLAATTLEPAAEVFRGLAGVAYYFRVSAIDADRRESSFVQAGPVTAEWTLSPHKTATASTSLCSKCHGVHSAQEAVLTSPDGDVAQRGPGAVCVQCHAGALEGAANVIGGDGDSFAGSNGHSIGTATHDGDGTTDCSSCHSIHGSAQTSPMLPVGASDTTHSDNCIRCHDQAATWAQGAYPDPAEPSRDASGYPVAGTWPGPEVYSGEGNAHARIAETTQTAMSGTAVRRSQGDCLYCHAGHGSTSTYDALRAQYGYTDAAPVDTQRESGDYARLCLDCHGAVQPARFTEAADINSFVTSDAPTAGHRIVTEGASLPVGSALPCYECHNVHGSARGNESNLADALGTGLSTGTPASVRAFCLSCHTTADTGAGWDSDSNEYRAVNGSERVVGLARTAGLLGLPESVSAHREDSARSCYECHGDDYQSGGSNVHRPRIPTYVPSQHTADSSLGATLTVGVVEAQLECRSCHSLELGAEHAKPTATSATNSCASCHPGPRDSVGKWSRTGCSVGACHEPGSATQAHAGIDGAHESAASDCSQTGCHSSNLAVTHSAASTTVDGVERTSCLVCHDDQAPPASDECVSCHPGYSPYQHAFSVPEHTAEQTGTIEITTDDITELYEDVDCASCHGSSDLGTTHNTVCASCHPVVVPDTVSNWDGTCAQVGCHSVTDATPQHEAVDAAHVATIPAEKDCFASGCHPVGSLAALHSQASTEVAGVAYESCQVCHRESIDAVAPAPESCLSCHPDATEDHAP